MAGSPRTPRASFSFRKTTACRRPRRSFFASGFRSRIWRWKS
ncbi:hypothetical protein DSM3645_02583 [Blastopirellula marina DSM 3645]|uniref:Uncharacterized protein n=1 Tax=Blastopirellula marina DSM 3645 TaxID=314230 RepID=A3ZVI0_9BACT|nr:hypothetical protein DSM3645_02583 [Blastopirellula marina DSM 3645]